MKKKAKNALVARFDSILTDNGVESKDWEKRCLAYEIKISVKDFTTSLTLKQTTMQLLKVWPSFKNQRYDILRHMIVKLDARR